MIIFLCIVGFVISWCIINGFLYWLGIQLAWKLNLDLTKEEAKQHFLTHGLTLGFMCPIIAICEHLSPRGYYLRFLDLLFGKDEPNV